MESDPACFSENLLRKYSLRDLSSNTGAYEVSQLGPVTSSVMRPSHVPSSNLSKT
jgi:hypothetical protein